MSNEAWKIVLTILFFPTLFQQAFVNFSWGADDAFLIMSLKRIFVLLPVLAIVFCCWVTIVCLITVPFRHKRMDFVTLILVTWWDVGRSIFSFWGGIFKFLISLFVAIAQLIKMFILAIWLFVQDLILAPLHVARSIGENVTTPNVPWIAVLLTLLWCLIEAVIFTYVTTPLIMDTLSNLTGNQLTETAIQIPWFFMTLVIALGSYAVLLNFSEAVQRRNIGSIVKNGILEVIVMMFEVFILYREFVDSIAPWFAQHASGDFELGIVGTLGIATVAWLGIRSVSWFLFASHGTPTILAIVQGTGLAALRSQYSGDSEEKRKASFTFTSKVIEQAKAEMDWALKKGDEILGAFVIPPLQLLASCINFCTLLFTSQHLFELPFNSIKEIMSNRLSLKTIDLSKKGKKD